MVSIKKDVVLEPYTTFKIGGAADFFVEVEDDSELREAVAFAHAREIPFFVVGGGSNILVHDDGVRGLIIRVVRNRVCTSEYSDHTMLHAGAGAVLDDCVRYTTERSWWGMENLSAIPGTVGGATVQNAGAYGTEVDDVLHEVRVYDTVEDTFRTLSNKECLYGYRDSLFKRDYGKRFIITDVTFMVSRTRDDKDVAYVDLKHLHEFGDRLTPEMVRHEVMSIRKKKFPDLHQYGTAGSFFKNPVIAHEHYQKLKLQYPNLPGFHEKNGNVKVSAAWILDHIVGLKGFREGDIGLWDNQPLVVVNYENGSAEAVNSFAEKITERVRETTDIVLEREVCTH